MSAATAGFDAEKKVAGRKRHVIVDCLGLLQVVLVTGASTQDHDCARPALAQLRGTVQHHQPHLGRQHLHRQSGRLGEICSCPEHLRRVD
ncbi:transposase [Nocardia sp. NPDC059239]|uniref:transposase n=1 Tax=Nocardia sp. NPDC059239 TaxID=3346785 RepID=UPI0036AC4FDE